MVLAELNNKYLVCPWNQIVDWQWRPREDGLYVPQRMSTNGDMLFFDYQLDDGLGIVVTLLEKPMPRPQRYRGREAVEFEEFAELYRNSMHQE